MHTVSYSDVGKIISSSSSINCPFNIAISRCDDKSAPLNKDQIVDAIREESDNLEMFDHPQIHSLSVRLADRNQLADYIIDLVSGHDESLNNHDRDECDILIISGYADTNQDTRTLIDEILFSRKITKNDGTVYEFSEPWGVVLDATLDINKIDMEPPNSTRLIWLDV